MAHSPKWTTLRVHLEPRGQRVGFKRPNKAILSERDQYPKPEVVMPVCSYSTASYTRARVAIADHASDLVPAEGEVGKEGRARQ